MGKSALLYVAAATVMFIAMYSDIRSSGLAVAREEGAYYEEVEAREIARSAFNILLSRARADFDGFRENRNSVLTKFRETISSLKF